MPSVVIASVRQVYMTIEQAEDLAQMLTETIQAFKAGKVVAEERHKADQRASV
jgi:hypothetical protein